jgi:hypothetical protein
MRRSLLTALAVLLAGTSIAAARPSTVNMSCAQAAATVASRGAVVLGTGGPTFDRFVAHGGFCQRDEYTEIATVPTADTGSCNIGYTCEQRHYQGAGF